MGRSRGQAPGAAHIPLPGRHGALRHRFRAVIPLSRLAPSTELHWYYNRGRLSPRSAGQGKGHEHLHAVAEALLVRTEALRIVLPH